MNGNFDFGDRLTEWFCNDNASVFGMIVRLIFGLCVIFSLGIALALLTS